MNKIALLFFFFISIQANAESLNIGPYWFSIGESERSALAKIKKPYSYVKYGEQDDYIIRKESGSMFSLVGQVSFNQGVLKSAMAEWYAGFDPEATNAVDRLFDALSSASKHSGLEPTVEIENTVSPTVNFDKVIFKFGKRSIELHAFELKDGNGKRQIGINESISNK